MSCLVKTECEEEEVECYHISSKIYQRMKYSYRRKQIAMRQYDAN